MLPAPANHHAAAIAASHAECALLHRRQNHHALRLVQQVLRNVVRNVQDFFHHFARIFYPVRFPRPRKPSLGRTIKQLRRRQPCECFSSWISSESFLPVVPWFSFHGSSTLQTPHLKPFSLLGVVFYSSKSQNWVTLASMSAIDNEARSMTKRVLLL